MQNSKNTVAPTRIIRNFTESAILFYYYKCNTFLPQPVGIALTEILPC